jgi:glutamate--cysteine ligase catalytic subunit
MADRDYPKDQIARVNSCLKFVLDRSKGIIPTGAHFIRKFVLEHPEYKRDSVVSNKIAFDLVSKIASMNFDEEQRLSFYGKKLFS